MPDTTYPGPQNIHRTELNNGVVVLVYENFAASSVVVEGYLWAGALSHDSGKAGLADFAAGMLLRGTENRSFAQIYETLESVGASLDFDAGRHITDFSASALAEDLELVLELAAEALRFPAFDAREIEKLRGEILTGLQIRANDTRRMAGLRFREKLYGKHPYGVSVNGYPETVQEITEADLRSFHRRHYGPQGMTITVVGAVAADDAVAKVAAAFGDWQNPGWVQPPSVPPAARPLVTLKDYVTIPDKTQADIVLGLPGPRRAAPDYLAASLANTVLGVFGMMGRLGATVREAQGLAYYVYSSLHGGLGPAPWSVATGVAPDKVEQATDSILREIERLRREPIPDDELEDSKMYRIGSLPVSLETNDGLASVISNIEFLDLGLDYLQRFPDMMRALTAQEVQAAAHKYLSAEEIAIVVAGPPQSVINEVSSPSAFAAPGQ